MEVHEEWSWREELNLQPVVYKTTALPLSYASFRLFGEYFSHGREGARMRCSG
ncbi:protein of unknown function [Nitrospira japonica]|uniref:Uncharacterized protein n=1 Tax=Nitrospira japonica TaxID=1325564 RepID=A0A1W1I765_9BACT|nr:protein of unknown function [Nitrospira japonica]